MTTTATLMDDDPVDAFVAAPAGIINGDRMARLQGMVIDRRTVVVHEWDVTTVIEPVVLVADAEVNIVAPPTAPRSI